MKEKSKSESKPGAGRFFLVLLILIGVSAGVLHYFGKLQPLIDKARQKLAPPPETTPAEPPVETTSAKPEARPTAPTDSTVAAPALSPIQPAAAGPEDQRIAAYRARFKAPKIGAPITLTLKNGQNVSGTVAGQDTAGIQIESKVATITFGKAQLSSRSLARCYEDEYVKYMLNLDRLREAEEKAMNEELARLKAEYERQREAQAVAAANQKANVSKPRPAKTSSNDTDFKKWMEQNGQSDFFKARQKRIAEYEAQRIAEGREY